MDTKFFSKNRFAIVLTILFIILLNYHDTFKFLLTTLVGRIILVQTILAISAFSIMFGVISVLFVVIRMNQQNLDLEGFNKGSKNLRNDNIALNSSSAAVTATYESFEGFNKIELETSMLKGKNSKEQPVHKTEQNKDFYVDPHSKIDVSPATYN